MDNDDNPEIIKINVQKDEYSEEERNLNYLQILSYSPDLHTYHFYDEINKTEREQIFLSEAYFNAVDITSIELITSSSLGNWGVYQTYALDDCNMFTKTSSQRYKIYYSTSLDGYEQWYSSVNDLYNLPDITEDKEMFKNGYIKALGDLPDNNFSIKKGEYFKAQYDNGRDKIFIEKENGDSSWVTFDLMAFGQLNQYYFPTSGF